MFQFFKDPQSYNNYIHFSKYILTIIANCLKILVFYKAAVSGHPLFFLPSFNQWHRHFHTVSTHSINSANGSLYNKTRNGSRGFEPWEPSPEF